MKDNGTPVVTLNLEKELKRIIDLDINEILQTPCL